MHNCLDGCFTDLEIFKMSLFPFRRLQKFKVQTANTVISGENSKLETMGTEQLLDLFSHKPSGNGDATNSPSSSGGGVKAILENLPDLWDHKQYDDEYDMSQFMAKLK